MFFTAYHVSGGGRVGYPSDEAILPFEGFTAIFIVPNTVDSSTLVEFNLEEGACELQVLCKKSVCTMSLSMSHTPLYELPIHDIPSGGVHEFMERGNTDESNVFILIAHPVRKVEDKWKQFISVYRRMHRVTDGDAEIDRNLLYRRCGGNSISTSMTVNDSMIKVSSAKIVFIF
ncbi:unnamed protein product [Echinostoma caproni]|uniref:TMV resistance protein N-like n=1 Tax=Echinostoma caproni TaxID=27848 RepID=A0A183B8Z7_9TREM|nr:unnamed protein product [Echinostoma caproni]